MENFHLDILDKRILRILREDARQLAGVGRGKLMTDLGRQLNQGRRAQSAVEVIVKKDLGQGAKLVVSKSHEPSLRLGGEVALTPARVSIHPGRRGPSHNTDAVFPSEKVISKSCVVRSTSSAAVCAPLVHMSVNRAGSDSVTVNCESNPKAGKVFLNLSSSSWRCTVGFASPDSIWAVDRLVRLISL